MASQLEGEGKGKGREVSPDSQESAPGSLRDAQYANEQASAYDDARDDLWYIDEFECSGRPDKDNKDNDVDCGDLESQIVSNRSDLEEEVKVDCSEPTSANVSDVSEEQEGEAVGRRRFGHYYDNYFDTEDMDPDWHELAKQNVREHVPVECPLLHSPDKPLVDVMEEDATLGLEALWPPSAQELKSRNLEITEWVCQFHLEKSTPGMLDLEDLFKNLRRSMYSAARKGHRRCCGTPPNWSWTSSDSAHPSTASSPPGAQCGSTAPGARASPSLPPVCLSRRCGCFPATETSEASTSASSTS